MYRLTRPRSRRDSFRFSRSAFEVGSVTPGTKVIISARRFQPFWRRKHATFRSQVDFATSAKSPHCGRRAVAAPLPIAPARSSSWASLCSPWAELQYPVLIHWQLHANTALCLCVASATLCVHVSPLFLPFGSNFKCSKRSKTREMRPKSRNFLWRCAAGKRASAPNAKKLKGHFFSGKMRSRVMDTLRR